VTTTKRRLLSLTVPRSEHPPFPPPPLIPILKWTHCEIPTNFLVTPYRECELQFGGKTVLAGLREICFDFFPLHQVIFILAHPSERPGSRSMPSVLDRGAHEEMELISTRHFDKFSVWSQKSCGNMKLRLYYLNPPADLHL
jgi:hypothetical protein